MRSYINVKTGVVYNGDTCIGKWNDGSPMTIEESVEQCGNMDYVFLSENLPSIRTAEIFDLATKLMISYAQAGVRPIIEDCFEMAKNAYNIKDTL